MDVKAVVGVAALRIEALEHELKAAKECLALFITRLGVTQGNADVALCRLDAALLAQEQVEELLLYAYRYDDKPHQFWLHAWRVAEKNGMAKEAREFEGWYTKPPGQ